jgi:drug/metabolite transporter (DMT)-like permease
MALFVVRRVDLLAVGAATLATAMTLVYRGVMEAQDGEAPLWWVQAALLVGAVLALAGAPVHNRRRVLLLLLATGLLGILGLLAILTIGFPILVAAGLTFLAALRDLTRDERPTATPAIKPSAP